MKSLVHAQAQVQGLIAEIAKDLATKLPEHLEKLDSGFQVIIHIPPRAKRPGARLQYPPEYTEITAK